MTEAEIKAKLYDLRSHTCNGRLTIRRDGTRDPDDHPCDGCTRMIALQNELFRMDPLGYHRGD